MAEQPNITITIDEDALRRQVADVVDEGMREAAAALRRAADGLDGGAFWRELAERHGRDRLAEYERGRSDEREILRKRTTEGEQS